MLRARSPLYFIQKEAEWKSTPTWTIERVIDANTIKLASMEPSPPSDAFIKNRTIFQMREEIQKSGAWLWELNWALRYTESVAEPFVITEAPFVADEVPPGLSEVEALKHPNTLFYFPVCWQVCLFGSRQRFDRGTDRLDSHDMGVARRKYRLFAQDSLISPAKLDDITDFCKTPPSESVSAGPAPEIPRLCKKTRRVGQTRLVVVEVIRNGSNVPTEWHSWGAGPRFSGARIGERAGDDPADSSSV
jgi:hypothetical protein